MADRWVVVLALAAGVGALRPSGIPLVAAVGLVVVARLLRRPGALCLAVMVLVSALAGRSLAGLDGLEPGAVAGEVTLLSDPAPTFGGMRADVRFEGRRLELWADGAAGRALHERLAGERVTVRGEVQPLVDRSSWLVARHVAGRLRAHAVTAWRPGAAPTQIANALRRTLVSGAAGFGDVERSLYTGLVVGDDREQPPALADDFRGAGLTHLLAVSGQNVAFVLVLAGPLLRRLRLWPRLVVTLAVIAMFGLVTRFEPSVLRAATMAGLAAALVTAGTPAPRLRIVALALTGLLVADPLLIRSVGFQLSSAATAAIVVVTPRLAAVLPGPRPLREAMAVTVAAQLGVAPVLLAAFGPLPVAALLANLLAVPLAGPVMMWGLTGGVAAGLAGPDVAEVLHVPTRFLLAGLAEVARRSASLPVGELAAPHLVVIAAAVLSAGWFRARRIGGALAAAAVAAAVLSAHAPVPVRSQLLPGLVRWHAGATDVVVLGGSDGRTQLGAGASLRELRRAGVRSIDLLVVADPSVGEEVVAAVSARHPVRALAWPDTASTTARLGDLQVRIVSVGERLVVEVEPVGSARERRALAGGLRGA